MVRGLKAGLSLMSLIMVFGLTVATPSRADASVWKVNVCHTPPGNPDNSHTIRISIAAVPAHLMHGDTLGECGGGETL